jgi:hypothetical protein
MFPLARQESLKRSHCHFPVYIAQKKKNADTIMTIDKEFLVQFYPIAKRARWK